MKKIIIVLGLCTFYHLPAVAESKVNQLIKEQQHNDNVIRQQNQIKKKDIYSSLATTKSSEINIPDESPCFRIKRVMLNHNFLNDSAIKKIRKNIAGRCLGRQGISRLAQSLQDRFIRAGYITTRIEIPQQDLSSNLLILNVVHGKIDEIVIEQNSVANVILPFSQGDILNVRHIEQGLENLQRVPGVDVKINIEPGKREGYSRIVIYTVRQQRWNIRASVNNWGDKSTGQMLTGLSGYAYNMAHINDIFYLSGSRSASGGYHSISAWYSFPLGYWEHEFFYSYSLSRQSITVDVPNLNYNGHNHYASIKTSRTLYRDRDKKVTMFIEALRRKSDYRLGDIRLALQKRDMSNIHLGINYKQNYPAAMLNSTLGYQRFTRLFGGHLSPDMAQGDVSSGSELFNLNINYLKRLNYRSMQALYDLNLGMQYAPAALVLQDQLFIGHRWSVRGFENSAGFYGDKGFYLQNTFSVNTGLADAEYYCGIDYGEVAMSRSAQRREKTKRLIGAATGFKGKFKSLGYDLSLSVPLLYPDKITANKATMSFNLYYQL